MFVAKRGKGRGRPCSAAGQLLLSAVMVHCGGVVCHWLWCGVMRCSAVVHQSSCLGGGKLWSRSSVMRPAEWAQ